MKLNIETIVDNPHIGMNLQDHLNYLFSFTLNENSDDNRTARPNVDKNISSLCSEVMRRLMGYDSILNQSGLDMM